jgi:hypothetical protein
LADIALSIGGITKDAVETHKVQGGKVPAALVCDGEDRTHGLRRGHQTSYDGVKLLSKVGKAGNKKIRCSRERRFTGLEELYGLFDAGPCQINFND